MKTFQLSNSNDPRQNRKVGGRNIANKEQSRTRRYKRLSQIGKTIIPTK